MKPSFHSLTTISTWNQSKKPPNQIGLTGFRDKVATQLLTSGGRTFTADCLSWQRTGKQNILWSLKPGVCAFNSDLPDRARREFSFGESYAIFTHAPEANVSMQFSTQLNKCLACRVPITKALWGSSGHVPEKLQVIVQWFPCRQVRLSPAWSGQAAPSSKPNTFFVTSSRFVLLALKLRKLLMEYFDLALS